MLESEQEKSGGKWANGRGLGSEGGFKISNGDTAIAQWKRRRSASFNAYFENGLDFKDDRYTTNSPETGGMFAVVTSRGRGEEKRRRQWGGRVGAERRGWRGAGWADRARFTLLPGSGFASTRKMRFCIADFHASIASSRHLSLVHIGGIP